MLREKQRAESDRVYGGLLMIICFVLGALAGKIQTSITCKFKGPIYYISQEEILTLEKERVGTSGKALFYGKNQEAFLQIDKFIKDYEKQGKPILLSKGEILGNQALSVSKEVYDQVLRTLQNEEYRQDIGR